jgi:hypothetical protein
MDTILNTIKEHEPPNVRTIRFLTDKLNTVSWKKTRSRPLGKPYYTLPKHDVFVIDRHHHEFPHVISWVVSQVPEVCRGEMPISYFFRDAVRTHKSHLKYYHKTRVWGHWNCTRRILHTEWDMCAFTIRRHDGAMGALALVKRKPTSYANDSTVPHHAMVDILGSRHHQGRLLLEQVGKWTKEIWRSKLLRLYATVDVVGFYVKCGFVNSENASDVNKHPLGATHPHDNSIMMSKTL